MSFIDKYIVKFFSTKVGEDHLGNQYYIGPRKDYLGKNKRYVIYKGIEETSKIPPMWHAWLHYLVDDLPKKGDNYEWQSEHLPNLSGTKYAYDPSSSSGKKVDLYQKWEPK